MNESPSADYQFDHTYVDICVLDPCPTEGQHIENFVQHHLVICYDPFSRLVERAFFLTEEPTEHDIHEQISASTLFSDRAS
ncbi:MAG TPA: hypothetical protein VEP90_03400, partial [Methylomirabilota bacterium]|nr:hypothetical protein [Methylomirabilota bacterium]